MRLFSIVSLICLLTFSVAKGQTAPSPAEQMLNDMLQPNPNSAGGSTTTRPALPQVLEPIGHSGTARSGQLLREGSDIVAQHGHLKKIQDAPYSRFTFDGSPASVSAGSVLPPMSVLPNLQLMSMEDAASATKEDLDFTVSGTVTEYHGKNYVLLEPGPDEISRQLPSSGEAQTAGASPVRAPASADQLLKDMLSAEKPAAKATSNADALQTDLTSGPGAVAPKAPVLAVLPDRSQIFDRVCRLGPSADGQHEELTFEADGASMGDPPLIILPNLKLADLEKAAGDRKTRVRVTGIITEYRGRNYILLQKIVVMPDSDRQF